MINLQDAWKRTMNTIGNSPMGLPIKTAGTIFNTLNKPKAPATPSLNYTPMSTSALQSSIAPKQNNTPEIKGTTLSKPNFNPNANVLNQNLMTNYNQPQNDTIGGAGQMIKPQQPVDLPQLPQVSTPTPTLPTTPVESEADKYFKMYLSSLGITPEEEALQTQLSNITTGADLGVAGLEGQGRGIPLNLVRGQQEKLLKQAAIQAQPLQKQLELLQARRQAEAEMAKAASDYYGTETYKPTTVGAGETLIDPVTGKVIYQGAPKASDFKSVGAGETLIDPTTGKVIYQGQPKEQSMSEKYGTGIIGEYNFYADQERQLGREPISFNEYQNIDANRKAKIAASSIADASGMTTKQNQNFMTITNKFQADKTIGFAEKGVQTIAIADQVLANPGSAINQLKVLYSLVKALDPDSAVREGELDLAQSTQSYLQKWQNTLNRISTGKIVNAKTAEELATATKDLAQEWYKAGRRKQAQYQAQAQVAGVGNAFNEYLGMYEQPYMQPLESNTPQTMMLPNGTVLTLQPDGTYE